MDVARSIHHAWILQHLLGSTCAMASSYFFTRFNSVMSISEMFFDLMQDAQYS
jgi:hypothetical protein